MQGRTSDYHTKLRGKKRDYDDTNFDKENSGQKDLEEATKPDFNSKGYKEASKLVAKLRSSIFRKMDDHDLDQFRMVLAQAFDLKEYGQRLDLSYLVDDEARLDGTPKPKDAINRDLDEGTMIRLAGQIAQELLPKDTWSRFANDGKKNKEFVKSVVKDLAQTLNRFYKSHNISVRIKENKIELNEIGVFDIKSYVKGIIPSSFFNTTTRDKKEKLQSTLRDLKSTLNRFWKQHKIPYRIK